MDLLRGGLSSIPHEGKGSEMGKSARREIFLITSVVYSKILGREFYLYRDVMVALPSIRGKDEAVLSPFPC